MGSESTIEVRDGVVAARDCGNREDLGDEIWQRGLGAQEWVYRCRDGLFGERFNCRLSKYLKTATRPFEEMNYSGGGVGPWTSKTDLKGDRSWSWWCEPLIPRHSRHRQVDLLS